MEPIFDSQTLVAWYHAVTTRLFTEVFTASNIVVTAMQLPAVVGSGFGAWWVHDFVYPMLADQIRHSSSNAYSKSVFETLCSLIFPSLWALGLWVSVWVSVYFGWPHNLIWIAINLLTAWFVIRLASIMVHDPIWARLIAGIVYTVAVLNILDLLDPALRLLDDLAVTLGEMRISMLMVIKGMVSLGILLWAAVLISGILEKRIQRLPNLTPTVQVLIGKLFKVSIVTTAVIVALTSIGIDLTGLAVFGGALGVGIGFGLQKIVSNLISGIILLLDKSIKPGDVIQIGENYGWVSSLGARYVSVETRDGTEYLIPNEDIITGQVVSWTHQNDLARIKVKIRVAYYTGVEKALALMVEAARKTPRVLATPEPNPLLIGFADRGLDLELRFWVSDVQNGIKNVSSDVMLEIWRLFKENGIRVPFPYEHEVYLVPERPETWVSREASRTQQVDVDSELEGTHAPPMSVTTKPRTGTTTIGRHS
jgi:small-conductance mechanosensitive channel